MSALTPRDHIAGPIQSIKPSTGGAASTNGTGVDCKEFEMVSAVLNIGTGSATGTITGKLQESADNSTWADVTGANIDDNLDGAATGNALAVDSGEDDQVYRIALNMLKRLRYLRWVVTTATASVPYNADIIGFAGRTIPPTAITGVTDVNLVDTKATGL